MTRNRIRLLALFIVVLVAAVVAALPKLSIESRGVRFTSRDTSLAGTVFLPRFNKITAAVVLVHGAGQQARLTYLGQVFAARGIAVLTYDKRGVGESGGIYATEDVTPDNLEILSDDAIAAIRVLARSLPAGVPIGMAGISQAGWIVPLAAAKTPDTVKFLILFSGPVVSTYEQRGFEKLTNLDVGFPVHHTEDELRRKIAESATNFRFGDTDPRTSLRSLSIPLALWRSGYDYSGSILRRAAHRTRIAKQFKV